VFSALCIHKSHDQYATLRTTAYAKAIRSKVPYGEIASFFGLCAAMLAGTVMTVNRHTYPWLIFFALGFAFISE
jgi:hypothetical protein